MTQTKRTVFYINQQFCQAKARCTDAEADRCLRLFSVEFFFWWFSYATQSFYNAIQKPRNAAILTLSTAIVFPLIMVAVPWPLGLDGLWLNQAATYVPVGIIAFFMLRRTQKELAPNLK